METQNKQENTGLRIGLDENLPRTSISFRQLIFNPGMYLQLFSLISNATVPKIPFSSFMSPITTVLKEKKGRFKFYTTH